MDRISATGNRVYRLSAAGCLITFHTSRIDLSMRTVIHSFVSLILPPTTRNGHTTRLSITLRMRVTHARRLYLLQLIWELGPAPPSCLLAHWESYRLLSFRCVVQSHCLVIFF